MKNKISHYSFIIIHLMACCLMIGCQSSEKKEDPTPAVSAVWESPAGLNHWKFVLLEDGTLSEVVRSDAQKMIISEGGFTKENQGITLRYVFGPCQWSYDEQTNVMKIEIVLNDFYIKAGENELSCALIDEFEGPLSGDGQRWTTEWTTTMKYDGPYPDKIESERKVVFSKIEN